MLKQMRGTALSTPLLLGSVLSFTGVAAGQAATPVPVLDLNRFMGAWYEIARFPYKPEKTCVSGEMVLYAVGDKPNTFQVVNSCLTKDGSANTRNANGKRADKIGDGKLKVTYLFPFSIKYWVLATGPDYDWALLGSPNHKSFWVLSRTSTMKPEVLAEAEAQAAAQGFNASKLVKESQHH